MRKSFTSITGAALLLSSAAVGGCGASAQNEEKEPVAIEKVANGLELTLNPAGVAETVHTSGTVDRSNPFFQPIGTNPRTCETCHTASQGWTITADGAKLAFAFSQGTDPLFLTHDAGSRPDADLSTLEARKAAFQATLLDRGLTRFTRNISPTAEFVVAAVNDPYGFSTLTSVSAFRRPTPTANETKVPHTGWNNGPQPDVALAVFNTSAGASRLHLQRVDPLPVEVQTAMRDLQFGIVFAQAWDFRAGPLDAAGAKGGAPNLLAQPFYPGINDIQGLDPQGHAFTRKVFDLFDAWSQYAGEPCWNEQNGGPCFGVAAARGSIYRGQELFNNFEFDVSGVTGLNDLLGQTTVRATCSTCHNAPNVGVHSVFRMFDLGTANEENCSAALPLLTLQNKATGEQRKVCDMGRAGTSGRWVDVGGFRAPPLRGLAARAPYFHDGQARDIGAVVDYYQGRFSMGMTAAQRRDLIAFLRAL